MHHSEGIHRVTLFTAHHKPLLEGDLRVITEYGLKSLPTRFPGLKVVSHVIYPNRVELLLDFQKLDEDVLRVVQSFKAEVKTLAKKKGFSEENLWQWNYEDEWVPSQSH